MPEYIRSLIVILGLATVVFYFVRAPATAVAITPEDFVRRRNTWFFITLAGFLSQNYWVFAVIASLLIYNAAKKDSNKIALFFFLVLALPQIKVEIPGFAGIRYFLSVDYVRILSAFILLPVCIDARRKAVKSGEKGSIADKLLAAYILLNLALQAQHDIATNTIRTGVSWLIDVVIPYYAISRTIKDLKSFRDVLMSFVVATMLSSLIGVFEFVRHWILYASAGQALGVNWDPGYLARGEFLRASSSSGHSIVLGYVIAIGIGFLMALRRSVPSRVQFAGCLALLLAGVLAPLSRGSWVGLAIMLMVFTFLGERPMRQFVRYLIVSLPLSLAILASDFGPRIVDYLPFIGSVDEFNVTYRQNLFDTSLQIILDNPFFGSADYLLHMEDLRQGQGIIDLVNSYLIVGLNTGFVGLGLYVLFFAVNLISAFKRMKATPMGSELHIVGQSLVAVNLGVLAIIATASPLFHIPVMLWSVAAMSLAFGALKNPKISVSEK